MNNGSITITANSTFHGESMRVSFSRCAEGVNVRRLRGPRSRYCLDYSNSNSHVCGCGFPASWARWESADGEWGAEHIAECGPDGREGRGYITFRVFSTESRERIEADEIISEGLENGSLQIRDGVVVVSASK